MAKLKGKTPSYPKGSQTNVSSVKGTQRPVVSADPKVRSILGTNTHRAEHNLTGMEKIYRVRRGVSRNDLEKLKENTALDYDTLAKVLSVAKATLFNKKGAEKFNASLSEKIFALADLYSYGYEVFGDQDNFRRWIQTPNKALGGEAPLNLLDTIFGIEEIKSLVGRIDYGVYS